MKKPIQFQTAYKVVGDFDGRLFSANPMYEKQEMIRLSTAEKAFVIEYEINKQSFPKGDKQVIFVVQDLENAKLAKLFYDDAKRPIRIVRGLASDLKEVGIHAPALLPDGFESYVCKSFIPLEIIE